MVALRSTAQALPLLPRGRRARRRAISPRNRKRWRTPLRSRPRCAKQQQSMMTDYKLATTFFRRPPLRPRGTAADEPVAALRECDTRTRRTRWAESWGFPPIMPTLQRATAQREAAGDAAPKEREHGGELLSGVRERCVTAWGGRRVTGPYGPFCMRGKLSPTPHKDLNELYHRGISHTTSLPPQVVHRPPLAALGLVSAKGARRVFLGCGVGNGNLRCWERDHRVGTTPISRRLWEVSLCVGDHQRLCRWMLLHL